MPGIQDSRPLVRLAPLGAPPILPVTPGCCSTPAADPAGHQARQEPHGWPMEAADTHRRVGDT